MRAETLHLSDIEKAALFQEQPSIQSKIPWIIQPIYRLNQAR